MFSMLHILTEDVFLTDQLLIIICKSIFRHLAQFILLHFLIQDKKANIG